MIVKATLAVANDEKDGIARRCGHTFCENCINTLMKSSAKCPLCQSKIILTIPNHAVESCINQFVDKYFCNEAKTARANLLKERKEEKMKSIAEAENRIPTNHMDGMNAYLDGFIQRVALARNILNGRRDLIRDGNGNPEENHLQDDQSIEDSNIDNDSNSETTENVRR